jgi:hypothetical protein
MTNRTALYRHWDADGELLYVGISLSAVGRLAQHRASAPWFVDIANVTIEWFDTRAEAQAAEIEAITLEHPLHNKAHRAANDNQTSVRAGWSIYLVRHCEEKAIDGLVWAKNESDLWDVVDEAFDPAGYEYAEVTGCGGLLVTDGLGPIAVQRGDVDEDTADFPMAGFSPHGMLEDDLYDQARLEWKPFCGADEGVGMVARIFESKAA